MRIFTFCNQSIFYLLKFLKCSPSRDNRGAARPTLHGNFHSGLARKYDRGICNRALWPGKKNGGRVDAAADD